MSQSNHKSMLASRRILWVGRMLHMTIQVSRIHLASSTRQSLAWVITSLAQYFRQKSVSTRALKDRALCPPLKLLLKFRKALHHFRCSLTSHRLKSWEVKTASRLQQYFLPLLRFPMSMLVLLKLTDSRTIKGRHKSLWTNLTRHPCLCSTKAVLDRNSQLLPAKSRTLIYNQS